MKNQKIINKIITVSAWSFTLVICSGLFTAIGFKLDNLFGTPPMFMLGFLMLTFIIMCIRLYNEAMKQ